MQRPVKTQTRFRKSSQKCVIIRSKVLLRDTSALSLETFIAPYDKIQKEMIETLLCDSTALTWYTGHIFC